MQQSMFLKFGVNRTATFMWCALLDEPPNVMCTLILLPGQTAQSTRRALPLPDMVALMTMPPFRPPGVPMSAPRLASVFLLPPLPLVMLFAVLSETPLPVTWWKLPKLGFVDGTMTRPLLNAYLVTALLALNPMSKPPFLMSPFPIPSPFPPPTVGRVTRPRRMHAGLVIDG